jgi:ribosomal protein L7Ae-like RNA K-turn-binding protein
MAQNKFLSLLGMCRRAGRLQWGHDACLDSVRSGSAALCLLAADASERLRREFHRFASDGTDVIDTVYTMQQFEAAVGLHAGVLSTADAGFAKELLRLYRNDSREDISV